MPSKLKKIFITGMVPTNTNNRGDDAVFYELCSRLKKKYNNVKIIASLRHPSNKYDKFFGVKTIKNFEFQNKRESINKFYKGFNYQDSTIHLANFIKYFKNADRIIIGGSPFEGVSDENVLYGQGSYAHYIAFLAKILRIPYEIYAMKQTNFKSKKLLNLAKFVIENAQSVSLREKYSLKVLKKFKIRSNHCKVIGDPVFNLQIDNNIIQLAGKKLKNRYKINQLNKKKVIICYRNIYWSKSNNLKKNKKKIIYICKLLLKNDYHLFFVPLQDYENQFEKVDNDNITHKIIKKNLKNRNITVFDKGINLFETLYLSKISDFAISNRRHISAFSYIMKKKCYGILENGNEENLLPMFNHLNLKKHVINIEEKNKTKLENYFKTILNV